MTNLQFIFVLCINTVMLSQVPTHHRHPVGTLNSLFCTSYHKKFFTYSFQFVSLPILSETLSASLPFACSPHCQYAYAANRKANYCVFSQIIQKTLIHHIPPPLLCWVELTCTNLLSTLGVHTSCLSISSSPNNPLSIFNGPCIFAVAEQNMNKQ